MPGIEGFFELQTPVDLLAELGHDFLRIVNNPVDTYAAFDFFVTAEHLLDWKYPDTGGESNKITRTNLRKTISLLRVTSHLANGAKHFKATSPRHKSVDGVHTHNGAFGPGFSSLAFNTSSLIVDLAPEDAADLGSQIGVPDLASRILDYWKVNVRLP